MTTIFRLRDRTEGFTGLDRQLATNRGLRCLSGGTGAANDNELQFFGLVTRTLSKKRCATFATYPQVAAIVADKTARSSAGVLPTSVGNLEIMSLPASALAGERFAHTRTLRQARSRLAT